jgi:hypothetical protein
MNGKKRGIRLKPVNEEQEGYRALFDFFADDPQRSALMRLPEVQLVNGVDQGTTEDCTGAVRPPLDGPPATPLTARQRVARLVREELEETLRLLDKALMMSKTDRPER